MKTKLIFIWKKQKIPNRKNCNFSAPPISNLPFGNNFLQFKACKSGKIDATSIKVAQQIKLSGCLTKGYFTAKSGKNALKWPFVGQFKDSYRNGRNTHTDFSKI